MRAAPALVAVAHGSRDARTGETVRALLGLVREQRPHIDVVEAYVELTDPVLDDVLPTVDGPAVLVPLLLGPGYHVGTDLPRAAERHGRAVVAAPLGPDPALADVLAERLAALPDGSADAVVLAAAGSSDPRSAAAVREQAALLAERVRARVDAGFVTAVEPRVPAAVAALRAAGARRVHVAPYLLAPGTFTDTLAAAGADAVADPLGAHPALARLVLARYDAGAGGWRTGHTRGSA